MQLIRVNNKEWQEQTEECTFDFQCVHENRVMWELRDASRNTFMRVEKALPHKVWLRYERQNWYVYDESCEIIEQKEDDFTFQEVEPRVLKGRKDICIVTLGTPNMEDMLMHSVANQNAYARKHGYEYISYSDTIVPMKYVTWNKVYVIDKHIREYEWVVWIDSDAIFTNFERTLEEIIEQEECDGKYLR